MEELMVKPANTDAITLWTKRITDCKNSGLRTPDWCAENKINVKTYYYWHNKIHKLVERQQTAFYEVPVSGSHHGSPVATVRIGMIQADIYQGADAGTIQAICRALKTC